LERDSSEAGTTNASNDEQFSKAPDSIRLRLDPSPNITDERDRQPLNDCSPRDSAEGGMEIESNLEQRASAN
jgi:hypothetical protein